MDSNSSSDVEGGHGRRDQAGDPVGPLLSGPTSGPHTRGPLSPFWVSLVPCLLSSVLSCPSRLHPVNVWPTLAATGRHGWDLAHGTCIISVCHLEGREGVAWMVHAPRCSQEAPGTALHSLPLGGARPLSGAGNRRREQRPSAPASASNQRSELAGRAAGQIFGPFRRGLCACEIKCAVNLAWPRDKVGRSDKHPGGDRGRASVFSAVQSSHGASPEPH